MKLEMPTIKVLLAEDHDIVREGTRRLLERAEDIVVVGEAGDGAQAAQLVQALRPDVVVMDIRMPQVSGIEATRQIKTHCPETRVLILSAYEDEQYVFPALQAGASGYLLKTASGRDLITAIRAVQRGEQVLDPHITKMMVQHVAKPEAYQGDRIVEPLTDREREVLQAAANGLGNKQIAETLSITTNTVQVHLHNIFGKLGVNSRTEAIAFALRQGWVKLE